MVAVSFAYDRKQLSEVENVMEGNCEVKISL